MAARILDPFHAEYSQARRKPGPFPSGTLTSGLPMHGPTGIMPRGYIQRGDD